MDAGGVQASEAVRLRRILEVGRSLVSQFDLEAVLAQVLEEARGLTNARYAALGVLDQTGGELERFITSGIDKEVHQAIGDLPRGRGVLGVHANPRHYDSRMSARIPTRTASLRVTHRCTASLVSPLSCVTRCMEISI